MKTRFNVIGTMDNWKKGDLPNNQQLNIVLAEYTSSKNGQVYITNKMVTDKEIDYEIDCLINELEDIRKKAKKSLFNINTKITKNLANY